MVLTDEEKLQNLADEAMNDAKKVSGEIQEKTNREFEEKVDDGEKKLLYEIYNYIQNEIDKIRKQKSLEVSRVNIKAQQEYFKYGDAIQEQVFGNVKRRIKSFTESTDYETYLLESCKNVIGKSGTELDILYMPKDEKVINNVKSRLQSAGGINFKPDESISFGGLKFFSRSRNILINDAFDEKMERAKELLSSLIGPKFTAI